MSATARSMGAPMPAREILSHEARWRPRVAVVAIAAGTLLMAGSIVQLTGQHAKVSELTLGLIVEHKRFLRDLISAVLTGLGALGVGVTLVFLWWSARARNPQTQAYIRILAIVGAGLDAVAGIGGVIPIGIAVHKFVTTGQQTYQEANHLTSGTGLSILPLLGYAGELLLAIAIVLVALAAMRTGLLTRFMGYFGMFAGVLFLFPIIPVPLVQSYWLVAVAYLLWGRWPTGTPRAWESGQAEAWPTAAELREQRVRAAGGRGGGGRAKPAPEPAPVGASASNRPSGANRGNAGARSGAKRKRKRRK
jgi:hypothetical protein